MRTVGVTGHINLARASQPAVAAEIAGRLAALGEPFEGFTSLAPGADQMFAWVTKAAGGDVVFVSPSTDIETTIPAADLTEFRAARSVAARTVQMPFDRAGEEAYYAAGAHIADTVDLLFAVWDGQVAGGLGGTADIVGRRREAGRDVVVVWPAGARRTI